MKKIFCAFFFLLLVTSSSAFASVSINATNFPDSIFRQYVSENFDIDSNGELSDSEISAVERISVNSKGISSLEGIKFFTSLWTLNCSDNGLTQLDLGNMSSLKILNCSDNSIGDKLYIDGCSNLRFLACGLNEMNDINLMEFEDLEYFSGYHNNFSKLDVGSNLKLTTLRCGRNQLTQLDLSKNVALMELDCDNNKITTLDLSKNTALKILDCASNSLTSIIINANTALQSISCKNNSLVSLTLPASEVLSSANLSPQTVIGLKYTLDNGIYTVDLLNSGYGISKSDLTKISSVTAYDTDESIITIVASDDINGTYSFSKIPVLVIYQYAADGENNMEVDISAKPQITTTTLEKGYLNRRYNVYLEAIGDGNLRWSIDDENKLPSGLSFSSSGRIYGTPNGNTGKYIFNLTVKDSHNETDMQECTLEIAESSASPESVTITTVNSDIPIGYVNVRGYSYKFEATASSTWSMDVVPSGLTFNTSSGRLSGTPAQAGDFVVNVTATDSKGGVDKQSFIVSIKNSSEQDTGNTGNTGNNTTNNNTTNNPSNGSNDSGSSGGGGCDAGLSGTGLILCAVLVLKLKKSKM